MELRSVDACIMWYCHCTSICRHIFCLRLLWSDWDPIQTV